VNLRKETEILKTNTGASSIEEKEMKNYMQSGAKSNSCDNRVSVLEIIGTATRGGMENHIINFLKNLSADKFRVTCICPCESLFTKALRGLGVEDVFITPLADDPEWRSIQMAIEIARLHRVDVFHAHMPKSHVLAGLAGCLVNKPVVATVHGMHVTAYELGVALAVKSHLITNCQETYIQALALGVPPERVNLFHNGVDIEAFNPGKSGKKLRDIINVPASSTLVGFVGRLEHEKGPDLFLRAAGYVHNVLPNVHFLIVGAGTMLKNLEQMRKQMRLERHLHFADWAADIADVYPAFDLMAHTSRSDGTSLALLEAMACGLPVVGMAVGGVREMIENEHTGMLVEPNDWEGMGIQIIQLLEQPKLLKTMGAAARKRVEEHFNVLTNTRKTATLLQHVAFSWKNEQKSNKNHKVSHALKGNGSLNNFHMSNH
jgi:glycosyltransferase involved in cell wall biosynthesis